MPDPESGDIAWFRPDPRAIIPIKSLHISRSLRRLINKKSLTSSLNKDFSAVIHACSDRSETWISPEFISTYSDMHRLGHASSIEVWSQEKLVGGLYGVHIGGAFFAESMFHRVDNASKIALVKLCELLSECGFTLLECQFMTPHLQSMGAISLSDREYMKTLRRALQVSPQLEDTHDSS